MANVAEAKKTHKRLATANVMHSMIFLMRSRHVPVHREACRCVANLLSSTSFHRQFLDDNGLNSLFRQSRSQDAETLFSCSVIFRKLAPVLLNHEPIISKGGLSPLQHLTLTTEVETNRQVSRDLRSRLSICYDSLVHL
jgi:hypothetical protein